MFQRYFKWRTDVVISVCSKPRRPLKLRRICHCIYAFEILDEKSPIDARFDEPSNYARFDVPSNFMLCGKRSATCSKSKAR